MSKMRLTTPMPAASSASHGRYRPLVQSSMLPTMATASPRKISTIFLSGFTEAASPRTHRASGWDCRLQSPLWRGRAERLWYRAHCGLELVLRSCFPAYHNTVGGCHFSLSDLLCERLESPLSKTYENAQRITKKQTDTSAACKAATLFCMIR